MKSIERGTTTAGVLLFIAFLVSVFLVLTSPFDTGRRGASIGALKAAAWLEMAWVVFATVLAVSRWRAMPNRFRVTFLLNAAVVCILAADLYFHH